MPLTTTRVTGRISLPDDISPERAHVAFTLLRYDTDAADDVTIIPDVVRAAIDAGGDIDVDLWPNARGSRATYYSVAVVVQGEAKARTFAAGKVIVPEAGPVDLNDIILVDPYDPASVAYIDIIGDAEAAADKSQEWAESPTAPGDVGTKSAKTWAGEAADSAALADSEGNATIALEARDDAEIARDQAEAARDASFVSANVYPDIATGRAAVADLGQFAVVSADGSEVVRYRRDSASTQTLMAQYPTSDAVAPLQKTGLSILQVADGDGNVAIDIRRPLVVTDESSLEVGDWTVENSKGPWLWGVSDSGGNIIAGVDGSGTFRGKFDIEPSEPEPVPFGYDYSINGVFGYGQSLIVGQANPLISTTPAYDNLMFEYGMRPQYDYPDDAANWYDSLVPAVEAQGPAPWGSLKETPMRGTGDGIKELMLSEDGRAYTDHDYKILLSAPGYGATTLAQLSKGTVHFTRLVAQAAAGRARANELGETFAVQAVLWVQGETDYQSSTTPEDYTFGLNKMVADIQSDIPAATGQSKRVAMIGGQVASHIHGSWHDTPTIAIAQFDVSQSNPDFFIACAMYQFPYQDGFHLTGVGSRWLGGYMGLAYKRIVIDGKDWKPLHPIATVRQGAIAEVRFHVPQGRLVFDTVTVPDQPSKGFQLVDAAGSPLTISSVEIVDYERVRIIATAPIPAGAKLRYAWQGDVAKGLGNLRDTQGNTIIFDPTGINKPLHNWSMIFEETLS